MWVWNYMSANNPRVIKILDLLLFATKKKKKVFFQTIFKTKRVRTIYNICSFASYNINIYDTMGQIRFKTTNENSCKPWRAALGSYPGLSDSIPVTPSLEKYCGIILDCGLVHAYLLCLLYVHIYFMQESILLKMLKIFHLKCCWKKLLEVIR